MKNMVGQDSSTIVVRRGEREIPVIFINRAGTDPSFDKEKIAANLRALLNGLEPTHGGLLEGKIIQFTPLPGAVGLSVREEGKGVSTQGLTININYAADPDIIADLESKIGADMVVRLCAATMVPLPPAPAHSSRPTLGR